MNLGFITTNDIDFIIVKVVIIAVGNWFFFDDFEFPIFFAFGGCFSEEKVGFEVSFFKLVERSLTDSSLFEFEVAG